MVPSIALHLPVEVGKFLANYRKTVQILCFLRVPSTHFVPERRILNQFGNAISQRVDISRCYKKAVLTICYQIDHSSNICANNW